MIVKKIFIGFVSGGFDFGDFDDKNVVASFVTIWTLVENTYLRFIKDKIWRDIVIDKILCWLYENVKKNWHICANQNSWSSGSERNYIILNPLPNEKLLSCLTDEIVIALCSGYCKGALEVTWTMSTLTENIWAVLQTVLRVTNEYCRAHDIIKLEERSCFKCSFPVP